MPDPLRLLAEGPARAVGNTPLVPLRRVWRSERVRVLAKLEWFNAGGSVKDRPALFMVRDGIERGALTTGKVLVDATSGNTGISYAMLGAALGFRVRLFLPANVSPERKQVLAALGAELVLTDPLEGQDGAIEAVRAAVENDPDAVFYPDQYSNPANPQAHYETTGPEIERDTGGAVTHVVLGLGTTGTCMGVSRFLKEQRPSVEVVAVEPAEPLHALEGLKHLATSLVPSIYDASRIDRTLTVGTEEAHAMARRLAREDGLYAGQSSGAAVAAALRVARELDRGTVVTVLPDAGDKYVASGLFRAPPT